jgi:hypothetical protein
MSQERLPFARPRGIFAGVEHDMRPHGVRMSVQVLRRPGGPLISMHAYCAEVMPKARVEECPRGEIQWLARRSKNILDNRRNRTQLSTHGRGRLSLYSDRGARMVAVHVDGRCRHPHHVIGHAIRFPLIGIAGVIDLYFHLDRLAHELVPLTFRTRTAGSSRLPAGALPLKLPVCGHRCGNAAW